MVILKLIHAPIPNSVEGLCLLDTEQTQALPGLLMIHGHRTNRIPFEGILNGHPCIFNDFGALETPLIFNYLFFV